MSSPFPGMDPFLEGEMWQEFHVRLASQISEQLMPLLRPKYVALLEKRYVLDRPIFGISQRQLPSVYATCTFFAVGMAVTFLIRALLGGA